MGGQGRPDDYFEPHLRRQVLSCVAVIASCCLTFGPGPLWAVAARCPTILEPQQQPELAGGPLAPITKRPPLEPASINRVPWAMINGAMPLRSAANPADVGDRPESGVAEPAKTAGPTTAGERQPIRLRFTIGGRRQTSWEGQIRLTGPVAGQWQDPRLLSIEPQALGSVQLSADRHSLILAQPESLEYGSFEVDCLAGSDAQLEIQLRSPTHPQLSFYQLVELAHITANPWSLNLGPGGNGIWIERPPADQIRFQTTAPGDLVPVGQPFEVQILPNRLQVARGSTVRYVMQLSELTTGHRSIREERGELKLDANGDYLPPPALAIMAGPTPGVYQIQVDFFATKSGFTLLPGVSNSTAALATRKLQWIAVDPPLVTKPRSSAERLLLAEANGSHGESPSSDPVERLRMEPQDLTVVGGLRVLDLPRMPWLTRWQPNSRAAATGFMTKSSEALRITEIEGRPAWELGPNQWRTIELPPMERGNYRIEVEWREGEETRLGLDVVQPDRWGRVPHWTSSSLLTPAANPLLPQPQAGSPLPSAWRQWQTLHWLNGDRGPQPVQIVLSNSSPSQPAQVGSLRLWQMKDSVTSGLATEQRPQGRGVGVYLDTPLITSLFSSRKVTDSAETPPLNDWLAYHDSAERLRSYLAAKQYNSIWLPVYKQGGALFPTAPFASTPRFENSVFGTLGQPQARMDVVELLLHTLSQHQLTLVPVLDFSIPLQRIGNPPIRPTNPLDPEFQQAVLDFVTLFVGRYQRHAAFAGLAMELAPDSPLLFSTETAGISPAVVARFLAAQSLPWPTDELGPLTESSAEVISQWVLRHHRGDWLAWRAAELTDFFEQIQGQLASLSQEHQRERIQLHLVLTNLHRQPLIEHQLYPSLRSRPNWQQNWLRLGLVLARFNQPDSPSLVIQQAANRGSDLAVNRRVQEAAWTPEFWQSLAAINHVGKLTQRNTQQTGSEALSESTTDHPGQVPQTFQVVETSRGHEGVWAEALRRHDCRQLLSQAGGLPRTLHPAERQFAQVFGTLINQRFDTLYQDPSSSVAIRQSAGNSSESQWYLVNAAAWPVSCRVQWDSTGEAKLAWRDSLSGTTLQSTAVDEGDNRLRPARVSATGGSPQQLVVQLAPHSLVVLTGPRLDAPTVTVTEGPAEAYDRLQAVKESLFRRLRQVTANTQPLKTLSNSGFEQSEDKELAPRIPNWTHGPLSNGQALALDRSEFHDGTSSLKMTNTEGVLWLRSSPLPPPTTGRLSVTAWIKNSPELPAQSIRLSLDGQSSSGAKYYRFAEIALTTLASASSQPETTNLGWQPVAVHFDDLPDEDLVSLRIGFDLMQPGSLWLDSVQCFDRWLDANDQKVLSNRLGLAAFSLENKRNLYAAYQALDDYWLRFLLTHIPDPNLGPEPHRSATDIPAAESRPKSARGRRFLPLR